MTEERGVGDEEGEHNKSNGHWLTGLLALADSPIVID